MKPVLCIVRLGKQALDKMFLYEQQRQSSSEVLS